MKIIHTGDLHIGKSVNGYSMLQEQKYILAQLLDIVAEEQPDAIILAGDIYDKSIPSAEAVCLFDEFLVRLAGFSHPVFVISGNHDSAERMAFASRLLAESRVYVSPVYAGPVEPVLLREGTTEVAFYLLPFVKPSLVQHIAPADAMIKTYNDALKWAVNAMNVEATRRNVLVTHQFITDAERSESEDVVVGGLDNVDVSVFDAFDYVALGHLHRPQSCGRETVRYSGSPLKYSFSEVSDKKSVTIVEISGDKPVSIRAHALTPLHDWHDLRGTYDDLMRREFYENTPYQEDFVRITLTDENDIPDGMRRLKTVYHNLMELRYDNKRTRSGEVAVDAPLTVEALRPDQLFEELFEKQNAQPVPEEWRAYLSAKIDEVFNP